MYLIRCSCVIDNPSGSTTQLGSAKSRTLFVAVVVAAADVVVAVCCCSLLTRLWSSSLLLLQVGILPHQRL